MLFNSSEYVVFFLAVLSLTWLVVGFPRLRLWLLLLASYYFYASNNHWLIMLILISTQVDYVAGLVIARTQSQRTRNAALVASIACNLGILGTFKYFNFFAASLVGLANGAGWNLSWVDLHIALPVGISFYTFQSMSYTIDVYRGRIPAEPSWVRFSFYVAFFPQLIAGPIVRASHFLPQLSEPPQLDRDTFEQALFLVMRGLFKKIVLADFLAHYADAAFNTPGAVNVAGAWIGVYAFSLQIYFDFSGYSDIAIGCSRLCGYRLPDNFRRPYMASSMADFWRRWHISLSSWLRDYLYIPLGGNRMPGKAGVYRNLMITMLLGGLWHGAAFHFVLWGLLHGLLLIGERMLGLAREDPEKDGFSWRLLARRFVLFHVITFTWLIFRSENATLLGELLDALIPGSGTVVITAGMALAGAVIAGGWLAQAVCEYVDVDRRFLGLPVPVKGLLYAGGTFLILVFNAGGPTPFIYFQF